MADVSECRWGMQGRCAKVVACCVLPHCRCAMVGDSLSDMRAAAAAGVGRRHLVATGYGAKYAAAAAEAGLTLPLQVGGGGSRGGK